MSFPYRKDGWTTARAMLLGGGKKYKSLSINYFFTSIFQVLLFQRISWNNDRIQLAASY